MPSGWQSDRPDAWSQVVTLEAEPGKVMWKKQMADNADGYYFKHVPMIVKRKMMMGSKGSGG